MLDQLPSIDRFLSEQQSYWRFEAFFLASEQSLPWQQSNPALCQWLESLTPESIEGYKQDTQALLSVLVDYLPCLTMIDAWTALAQFKKQGLSLPRGIENGVPGRKLDQILSMGEALISDHHGSEWLEWCSGKGFLGRILASQTDQLVTSFEYQQALCDSGQHEADKQGLAMRFIQGDALDERAALALNPKQHAVALHACGDLHVSLMHYATQKKLPAITLSPCCYHLVDSESYQALSSIGKRSSLGLTRSELRIPLQETVTGGERVKRHRADEMAYRLGFDQLVRDVTNNDGYLPVPSIKKSQLSQGFEAFCRWAAERKNIPLPELDFLRYEKLGRERYWQMERISLVQQPFRRVLELWLVLDKAIYLQEQGYQVQLSEFCPRETTPRNLLIHAVKA